MRLNYQITNVKDEKGVTPQVQMSIQNRLNNALAGARGGTQNTTQMTTDMATQNPPNAQGFGRTQ